MAIAEQEITRELGIRLSYEQVDRLEQAAARTGQSLDEFAAAVLLRAAEAALASPSVTVLSNRDFDHLMTVLDADSEPNETLKAAAAEYSRRLADGSLQTC